MHSATLQGVLAHLRKLTDPNRGRELSDGDLLDRFRRCREEAAFTLLVQRHGALVWSACRRILGDDHEAEDAFQATFLALVRKAGAIRKEASLSSWLHVVATHIAHKSQVRSVRRRASEREIPAPAPNEDSFHALSMRELRAVLDEEIAGLPDKYRTPLVLCYLADKSHEQAARELGWPKSSVTARLAKARELLRQRLIRRGITVPAGLLAMLLTETTANAVVPSLLTLSTVRLAVQALSDKTLAATTMTILAHAFAKGAVAGKWAAALALLAAMGLAAVIGTRMAAVHPSSPLEGAASKAQAAGSANDPRARPGKPRVDLFGDPLPTEAVARMGSMRMRHSGLRAVFFSPDGRQLVSSAHEGLRIWDAATGKLLRRIDFERGKNQTSCRYVGDNFICVEVGDRLIATVQVLDAATGQVRRRISIKDPVHVANPTLSPDGKRLAIARQNEIVLYDTTSGEKVQRIPVKGVAAWDIAFAPDSKTVAHNDLSTDTIYLHEAATGKLVRELKRPGDTTLHLVFSPDGRFLASMPQSKITVKGEVSIWDVQEAREVHRWTHPFPKAVSAAFSPDGKQVVISGGRWGAVMWDTKTGKEVRRLNPHRGVTASAFSPDGKSLATSSPFGAIRLWDTATGKILPISADPDAEAVTCLRFSADGKRLLGDSGACLVWDAATSRELKKIVDPKTLDFKHPNDMRCLARSPDEVLLAVAHPHEETILVWDVATGKEKHALKGDEYTWKLLFTPDSGRLISAGDKDMVHVWDMASGREQHQMPGRTPLTVSPDGRFLAAADARMMAVFVYDLTTGQEWKRFAFPQAGMTNGTALVFDLAFAPDGRSLAAVGYLRTPKASQRGLIRLWDLTDSERMHAFDGQKMPIRSVAFSPDGRTLATGGSWGELILWEVNSGRRRHSFAGHESEIQSLAFSPDGRTLAASSVDAPVYVWDVAGALDPQPHPLSNDELRRCWADMAKEDAAAAFQAIRRLAAAPERTLPFLREHLTPVPAPDLKRVRQLVGRLESDDFPTRQKAAEELEKHADAASGFMRQILAKEKPFLEVRRRLQQILDGIENKPESQRAVRAVEVLEWIATPAALRLLGELVRGAADARLTRETVAARKRLQR